MFIFSTCINNKDNKTGASQPDSSSTYDLYAGSASCANCHKSIYESHITTAHFHTSEPATAKSIKGSFEPGQNTFTYKNGAVVEMQNRGGIFYQAAYLRGVEKIKQRFDIVTGSGTKGQTYLSWAGDSLYQLPVSYFTPASYWSNSPGLPNNQVVYYRPITSRCLECHTTYAEKIAGSGENPERFNKGRMILGVDCEKCHGPAAKHVAFQTQNPNTTTAQFIINPATFSRRQSLDLCALCHGGRLKKTKPSFEFKAGERLADYFLEDGVTTDVSNIDVHGNQYGLLSASKCFQVSKTMTCITCHNVHENEQEKTVMFSQKCISCHNDKHSNELTCKMAGQLGNSINENCTNCHMPQLPSKAIAVSLQGSDTLTPATMHTHLIKSYPEETKKIIAFLKNGSKKRDNTSTTNIKRK